MNPIPSAALAATMVVALHASSATAQSAAEPALATGALASPAPSLSVEELVRLHLAVTSLFTHPTPDALAAIQQTQRLFIAPLETVDHAPAGPPATN